MPEWLEGGLEDDMRERMFSCRAAGTPFALATIAAAEGGPRPVGSQMVITHTDQWGFLSGGCIEADVALHGREVLDTGEPRYLVYGRGSPFIDTRLPCGGRLEVLIERLTPDDPALAELAVRTERRSPTAWESDGVTRRCGEPIGRETRSQVARHVFFPPQRLLVVGSDPFALAIAGLAARTDWDAVLVVPFGPEEPPPISARYERRSVERVVKDAKPDAWTAIAVATHDLDLDERAIAAALKSYAGYVGVLGSKRRLPERLNRLRALGFHEAALDRLKAPIGLDLRATAPWEVAVSVIAEIIAARRSGSLEHELVREVADAAQDRDNFVHAPS